MAALINPFWYVVAGDPLWTSVVLLLHCDGTNGAVTLVDSSSANHGATGGSGCVLTTAQAKFGVSSLQCATGAFVNILDSPDWWFGAGQFTVEAWVRPTAAMSGVQAVAVQWGGSTNLGWFFGFNGNTVNLFYSTTGTDNPVISGAYTPTANQWVHVAADRDGANVLRVYANGAVVASATVAATFVNSTRNCTIGNDGALNFPFVGQIDEVRITKGAARYAGAFTPPSSAFPNS